MQMRPTLLITSSFPDHFSLVSHDDQTKAPLANPVWNPPFSLFCVSRFYNDGGID